MAIRRSAAHALKAQEGSQFGFHLVQNLDDLPRSVQALGDVKPACFQEVDIAVGGEGAGHAQHLAQIALQLGRQDARPDGDVAEAEPAAGPEQPGGLGHGLGLVDEQAHGALANRGIEDSSPERQAFGVAPDEVRAARPRRCIVGVTHCLGAELHTQHAATEHPAQRLGAFPTGPGQVGHQVAGPQPHEPPKLVGQAQPSRVEGIAHDQLGHVRLIEVGAADLSFGFALQT